MRHLLYEKKIYKAFGYIINECHVGKIKLKKGTNYIVEHFTNNDNDERNCELKKIHINKLSYDKHANYLNVFQHHIQYILLSYIHTLQN